MIADPSDDEDKLLELIRQLEANLRNTTASEYSVRKTKRHPTFHLNGVLATCAAPMIAVPQWADVAVSLLLTSSM